MKPLKIRHISAELDKLGASEGYKALVINNCLHYNSIVKELNTTANLKREYLAYQLSVQIAKLLLDLKKFNKRAGKGGEEDNEFMQLLNGMKQDKAERQKKYEESKAANDKS